MAQFGIRLAGQHTRMNPVERVIRRVDAAQQRHRVSAFIFGVIKKYGDDNGGVLASNLAHSAFLSVFPLLLILVTVLVQAAASSPAFQADVLGAVSSQFPAIGSTLVGQITAMHRATTAGLVIGVLLLVWGASGLAQAGLFTMAQVWNLPGPARPGYLPRLARSALFLGVLAVGLAISMGLASLVTYGHHSAGVVILAQALAVVANAGLYLASFRVLTPKGIPARNLVPGAVAGGAAWTVLLALGAYVVHHDLRTASVYGIFATVLVLLAWIYLEVQVTVYAAELNVVLTRRLWPRTIVQPPLAEADRASMALQALQNQRRPEQCVEVTFTDRQPGMPAPPQTPRTPDEVTPPGRRAVHQDRPG
jgi:YihY family inner membrane protein